MAQGRKLPNIEDTSGFDALDLKLFEHVRDMPNWTYRSAAQHAECDVHTAWDRIRRIRRSDFVTAMREDLEELGGKMREAVEAALENPSEKPRADVATRLLDGLGVLVTKSKTEVDLSKVTIEQLRDAFKRMVKDDPDVVRGIADGDVG